MKKIIIISILLSLLMPSVWAQKKSSKSSDIAPEVYAYYDKLLLHRFTKEVFPMADTLIEMSTSRGDMNTACAAMGFKLQYYMQFRNRDSVEVYSRDLMKFAKENDCIKYYYWTWGQLIEFYAATYYYKTAEEELDKMQQEALADKNDDGIVVCYKSLAVLYRKQNQMAKAIEYQVRFIEYEERNNIEDFNIGREYHVLIVNLIESYRLDEAEKWMTRWRKKYKDDREEIKLLQLVCEMNYWIAKDNASQARRTLKEIQRVNTADYYSCIYVMGEVDFAVYVKNWPTALNFITQYESITGDTVSFKDRLPEILTHIPGREAEGIRMYQEQMKETALQNEQAHRAAIEEYSTRMDLEQLRSQTKNLRDTIKGVAVVISLLLFIGFLIFVLYHIRMLNRLRAANSQMKHLLEENARTQGDMEAMNLVRKEILPMESPEHPGFELCPIHETAENVRGNLYDYALFGKHLCFIVGECSYSGLSAILAMCSVCCSFRATLHKSMSAKDIVKSLNRAANINNQVDVVMKVCVGVVNLETGVLELCNAGQNNPLLISSTSGLTIAQPIDLPKNNDLGQDKDSEFEQIEVQLPEDGRLFLYTSGFINQISGTEKAMSEEHLGQILVRTNGLSLKEQSEALMQPLNQAKENGYILQDDLAALSIRFKGFNLMNS